MSYTPGKCQVLPPSVVAVEMKTTVECYHVNHYDPVWLQTTVLIHEELLHREGMLSVLALSASLTEHCTASVSIPSTHS